jgi:histidinol-phosphate aminotransferase
MKTAARYEDLDPYIPIEPFEVLSKRLGIPAEDIIKLDANENPYGPSPRARTALAELHFPHRYPDPESCALRTTLSAYTDVPFENLLAGAGADELIDLLLRVLLEPGETVLNFPPTFGMYAFDARLNHGIVQEVVRNKDFSLNLCTIEQAVERFKPKAIFITSPNNPDGSLLPPEDFKRLLRLPVLVVLDEAYIEFSDDGGSLGELSSRISEVPQHQNLVVLRTFSKWAGLAGLRIGYGAFPSWLIPDLWKAKQPYNVNVAASAAAIASLQDLEYLAQNVALLREERRRLSNLLRYIDYLQPFPSQANFILCKVNGRSARELKESLAKLGILVRYYDTPLLTDMIRISAGRPQDTAKLLNALTALA